MGHRLFVVGPVGRQRRAGPRQGFGPGRRRCRGRRSPRPRRRTKPPGPRPRPSGRPDSEPMPARRSTSPVSRGPPFWFWPSCPRTPRSRNRRAARKCNKGPAAVGQAPRVRAPGAIPGRLTPEGEIALCGVHRRWYLGVVRLRIVASGLPRAPRGGESQDRARGGLIAMSKNARWRDEAYSRSCYSRTGAVGQPSFGNPQAVNSAMFTLTKHTPIPISSSTGYGASHVRPTEPVFHDETKAREWLEAQIWA